MGYHQALDEAGIEHEIVGVDIKRQARYPFEFFQGNALEVLQSTGSQFDFIHASPPCQAYTHATKQWRSEGHEYPDLIAPTREALQALGKPYVIENVPGSPLDKPILLCGTMFGLPLYRHRLFETSFYCSVPHHAPHVAPQTKMGRPPKEGEFIQVVGHFSGVLKARAAMEIGWMGQKELAQAVPPAYTRYIAGEYLRLLKLQANFDTLGSLYVENPSCQTPHQPRPNPS